MMSQFALFRLSNELNGFRSFVERSKNAVTENTITVETREEMVIAKAVKPLYEIIQYYKKVLADEPGLLSEVLEMTIDLESLTQVDYARLMTDLAKNTIHMDYSNMDISNIDLDEDD